MAFSTREKRLRIRRGIRNKVSGTAERPRLSIFRSNKFIYAQLIDDVNGKTLVSASSKEANTGSKVEQAKKVGELVAEKASGMNLASVVFDRGGYKYHGRVKALADGAREKGLKF